MAATSAVETGVDRAEADWAVVVHCSLLDR